MIDICTVVFEPELLYLKAQARSVELYCANIGIRSILIMVNDERSVANKIDPAWWGSLQDRVTVIPRQTFSTNFPEHGWLGQQTLKLLGAAVSYNTWCMVLDAKTMFVHPFELNKLMDAQQRPKTGIITVQPVFESSCVLVSKLFDIDQQHVLGPAGPPFLFHTHSVRDMIADIECRVQQPFPDWFHAQGMITEFILYTGFLQSQGQLDQLYNIDYCALSLIGLWRGHENMFETIFQLMYSSPPLCVCMHRDTWTKLLPNQQQRYRDFLHSRGIAAEW
jgi:hypothetical protein